MIRRKKLVIKNISDGASASRVKTIITFRLVTSCAGVSGALRVRFIVGIVCAPKELTNSVKNSKSAFKTYPKVGKISADINQINLNLC